MLPGLWLHGGERQTAFAAVPAQQVHRFLDRDGVDVREQGVDQRQQLQLELAALSDLAVKEKLADFVGLTRRDVGENRDDALAAQLEQRDNLVIVAGIEVKLVAAQLHGLRDL